MLEVLREPALLRRFCDIYTLCLLCKLTFLPTPSRQDPQGYLGLVHSAGSQVVSSGALRALSVQSDAAPPARVHVISGCGLVLAIAQSSLTESATPCPCPSSASAVRAGWPNVHSGRDSSTAGAPVCHCQLTLALAF